MRLAILGAGGFIGSNLVRHLLDETDHELVGVDLTDEKLEDCAGPRFTFRLGDLYGDPAVADEVAREADTVVDLVAYANPSVYVEAPLDVFHVNFMSNLAVVEACVRHRKRLIQYSTAEVYGKPSPGETAYQEDTSSLVYGPVQKQRWIYAAGKQLLERVIHAYGLRGELDYTIIRPFNFVGPRLDYLVAPGMRGGPRVFAHYMSALLTGGPMYLVDGGHSRRSFTHIEDANEAFLALLNHPAAHGEIFNIGNPHNEATILELAHLMIDLYEELTDARPACELVTISGEEFYGVGYDDNSRIGPDVSKLRRLGWAPSRDLRTTLRDAIRFYLEHPQPIHQDADLVRWRSAGTLARTQT